MSYLPEFLTVAAVHLLAVMSPGPDFAMISRSSMVYSRRTGVWSSVGLALGILVHVTYSLVGIGFIIAKSILLFSIIKFLGAGYLIYIGWKSLRAKKKTYEIVNVETQPDLSRAAAIRLGFLTNALNPKATLFFLSLFTQVISSKTPIVIQTFYGIEMSIATFVWFALVATVLSHRLIKARFSLIHHRLEQIFGVILVALGLKVALSNSK